MRPTLLLIEDDPGIAAMLPLALRRLGYKVLLARDGKTAVEVATEHAGEIGVLLCDVLLPDGPGTQAAAAVRRLCPNAWTVFTSGYPMDLLAERGWLSVETLRQLEAGYLPKPFLPRDVHRMIEGAMGSGEEEQRAHAAITH